MHKFQKEKNDFLNKTDKSKRGIIDKKIKKLINLINKKNNYYTTSSCSGRIEILEVLPQRHANKLFVMHDKIDINDKIIDNLMNKIKNRDNRVYFKYESLILHVCCKTIDAANKLLKIARKISLKRSGIITKDRKIIVEIINPDHIFAPIAKNNKLLINKNYLEELIKEANGKMEKNDKKMEEFYRLINRKIYK